MLTHALPDQATSQAWPDAQSPPPSSPSSSPFSRSAVDGDSSRVGSTAAQAGSSTAWQFAEENVRLHALILRHMCQPGTDAQPASDQEADDAAISQSESSQASLPLLLCDVEVCCQHSALSTKAVDVLYNHIFKAYHQSSSSRQAMHIAWLILLP